MKWIRQALVFSAVLAASLPARTEEPDEGVRGEVTRHLVRLEDNRLVPHRWDGEPEILALYFGAGWCAPCHALQPRLREVYDLLKSRRASTELVFVSLDRSDREMTRYMTAHAMPWPALDRRRLPMLPALRLLAGKAPPNLVLLDRDGRILAQAWDGDDYIGPTPVLKRWLAHFDPTPPARR